MEILSRSLTFKHVATASDEVVKYIDGRRKGTIKALRTKWKKLNETLCGGFEAGTINTISGISVSGKSSFINSLETDLIDLNPREDIIVLNFSLEMASFRQIGRKLSYKLRKTTNELYTAVDPLSDTDYQKVKEEADKIKNYPIYYVDTPGTTDEVKSTIDTFRSMYGKDKWLIIMYDHTLLTKPKGTEGERETVVALQRVFNEEKKVGKTTIIQLTQLNREIESEGRINNPNMHFPQRKDISTSDAVYQISDLVLVLHRPEILGRG